MVHAGCLQLVGVLDNMQCHQGLVIMVAVLAQVAEALAITLRNIQQLQTQVLVVVVVAMLIALVLVVLVVLALSSFAIQLTALLLHHLGVQMSHKFYTITATKFMFGQVLVQ